MKTGSIALSRSQASYPTLIHYAGEGFCPLRCGPGLVVSVDHGGKLFERVKANEPAKFNKRYRQHTPRHSTS